MHQECPDWTSPGTPERAGRVGQADGSSLFLDEIGELPAAIQARLLRVLDEGEYHRLGEPTARRSDFRLIAATNRPDGALKHDVLARYLDCCERFELTDVVRITGDCPLIDPAVIDRLIRAHTGGDWDLTWNPVEEPGAFPRGMDVEVVRVRALRAASMRATRSDLA